MLHARVTCLQKTLQSPNWGESKMILKYSEILRTLEKQVGIYECALSNTLTQCKPWGDHNNETCLTPKRSPLCLLFCFELDAHMFPWGIWKNIHLNLNIAVCVCFFKIWIPFCHKDFWEYPTHSKTRANSSYTQYTTMEHSICGTHDVRVCV